jgi:hypothetical protein
MADEVPPGLCQVGSTPAGDGKMTKDVNVLGYSKRVAIVIGICLLFGSAGTAFALQSSTAGEVATAGRVPEDATRPDGSVDLDRVPDLVGTLDRQGNLVGYAAKEDVFRSQSFTEGDPSNSPTDEPVPVVSLEDRRTVIGHMYPGRGFVPLGSDPKTVPTFPVSTGPDATDQ